MKLRDRRTGSKFFVMGDMNERVEFCRKVKRRTGLWAMNARRGNACPVPPGGPDWMMGTRKGVVYKGFRKRRNGISDHPMLTGGRRSGGAAPAPGVAEVSRPR